MAKPRILIVEDERIVAEDIHRTLRNFGYDVASIVYSGREAIEKAEENTPDLVLMDIKLRGDMDGVEAAKRIRDRFDIPVVYITALAEDSVLQRAKITEPFGYIHKPIGEKELHSSIEIALYKHGMERKLRESEERYRNLVEMMSDVIYSLDKEGKITSVNKAIKTMFGFEPEEVIGRNFTEFAIKEAVEKAREDFKQIREGKSITSETTMIDKKGKLHNVESSSTPMIKDGKVVGSQGIVRDITDRKQMEKERERLQAQLVQSEKMAGIGTLTSGIAHEFNNLLQIVRGHTEFAQRTKRAKDMEEALDIVLNSSDKAVRIIRDLLAFSREEAPEKELCDITEQIEAVLSLIKEQLEKRNIEVVKKYRKIPKIEANKGEIQQVFLNMVTNARDSMLPKGGKLEIRVKQVKGNVEVSFTDKGEGIEKENLGKVFEPFYTTKGAVGGDNKIQGVGLGLSVSYGIVKRHGGTIEVDSEAGKGTTFTIKLPLKGEENKKVKAKDKEKKKRKKPEPMNILVVDDEEDICKMFTKWLSVEGYKVKSTLTGKEAINLVKKKHFNVVFLDIVMPGIPGVEILERIKEISPETKVVMITGSLMKEDLWNELRQKGASGYIQKPFRIEDINKCLAA